MSRKINVPLNRVEGDLEVQVEIDNGVVTDAWCGGTMYRGFEKIMLGRGALDGLVITPRICGICSTNHLVAAVGALDSIAGVALPPDAVRIRNLSQMVEHIQSDVRHGMLMFAVDFVNPRYQDNPLYAEAMERYQPFKGSSIIETVRATKKVLEIIAILGGQWPHSSFMVPGGIVSLPGSSDLLQCGLILRQYRIWYEHRILGCSVERWNQVRSAGELDAWLEEKPEHKNSDLGFFVRYARSIGLDRMGRGYENFLSFGSLAVPADSAVAHPGAGLLIPAGVAQGTNATPFDQVHVAEHIAHSWYTGYDGARHPYQGETTPYASGREGGKYTWAKAPRYDGLAMETGPLAEMVLAGQPLVSDLVRTQGANAFVRELARLSRPTGLFDAMATWLCETKGETGFYTHPGEIESGEGFGLTQASRGALGHWVKLEGGSITHYQVITPTAWNFSPRDSLGARGPVEQALVGTTVRDPENPVELGHVVRSFDACLVCTVHTVSRGKRRV